MQAVLLHVVRDVLAPGWTPPSAARHLVESYSHDSLLLRQARSRVRAAAAADRMTLVHARAIATLNLAITDVAESDDAPTISRPEREPQNSGEPRRGRDRGR